MRKRTRNGRRWDEALSSRVRLLALILPLFFILPAAGAFYHQVIKGGRLREDAVNQSSILRKVAARRGAIYDRNRQPLAVSLPMPSIFAYFNTTVDREDLAGRISSILDEESAGLLARMDQGKRFMWIKRWVSEEEAERVRALRSPVLGIQDDSKRFYPNGTLAASVIGFAGPDGGLEGLERSLQDHLKGEEGVRLLTRDGRGRLYLTGEGWVKDPVPGSSVTLTIDRSIQFFAEQALSRACEKSRARSGAAVILEAGSGRILAMASWPSFDPNDYSRFGNEEFRNRAIHFVYEPGSTLKVFTVAAALEEGTLEEGAALYCGNGRFKLADRVISDDEPHGWLTVTGILAKSSNIGASKIGLALGKEKLERHLRLFGLGSRAEVLLPGEEEGIFRPAARWTVVDTASASFGQSLAVTPLQVVTAFNALANGGMLMRPYLVEEITAPSGEVIFRGSSRVLRRAASRESALKVAAMMEAVVAKGGSGMEAAIPGYRVAGKTGTAQKFSPEEGRYREGVFVSSFAGFAPAGDPAVTCVVMLDEPQGKTYHGGQVAAPPWREMMEKTLEYLGVPPDPSQFPPSPGPGKGGEKGPVELASRRPPRLPAGEGGMPDLSGFSLRDALRSLAETGCEVKVEGTGVVVEQSPVAGEAIPTLVQLTLAPKVRI